MRFHEGVIRNSFGNVPLNWIASEDAAELAVSLLLNPNSVEEGETTIYPTGSEQLSHPQIAVTLSQLLDRPLRYEAIDSEVWRRELIDLSQSEPGVNADMAWHITTLSRVGQMPPLNDWVRKLTGRTAIGLQEFVQRNRQRFDPTWGKAES